MRNGCYRQFFKKGLMPRCLVCDATGPRGTIWRLDSILSWVGGRGVLVSCMGERGSSMSGPQCRGTDGVSGKVRVGRWVTQSSYEQRSRGQVSSERRGSCIPHRMDVEPEWQTLGTLLCMNGILKSNFEPRRLPVKFLWASSWT